MGGIDPPHFSSSEWKTYPPHCDNVQSFLTLNTFSPKRRHRIGNKFVSSVHYLLSGFHVDVIVFILSSFNVLLIGDSQLPVACILYSFSSFSCFFATFRPVLHSQISYIRRRRCVVLLSPVDLSPFSQFLDCILLRFLARFMLCLWHHVSFGHSCTLFR